MALVVKDRVRETSTTTGTGTFTLAGALTGFQTFSSAIGNTNTTYYTITNGAEWETGIGTVGAGTLARTTVLESSNAGAAVTFTAGTKDVFCTYPASKSVYTDGTLGVASGGTGASSFTAGSVVFAGTSGTYTQNNAGFFWDNTNSRLGIGTAAPVITLDVRSAAASGANADVAYFMNPVNNVLGTATTIKIGASSVTTRYAYIQSLVSSGVNGQSLCFGTNANGATPTEKMRIDDAGNVGIGTTTTTYKTNIVYSNSAGGVAETGLYLRNTSTGNSTQIQLDGNRSFSLMAQGSMGAPAGGFTIQDNTAGASRLSIDSSGNVGIGTTSPTQKLDIAGTTSSVAGKTTSTTGSSYFTNASTGGNFYSGIDNSAGSTFGGGVYFRNIYSDGAYPLLFWTNGTERMRIHSSGGVSIGNTTDPSAGNLSVTGGTVSLTNGTSNLISYNSNGVAAPTFTTRSAGTKLVLYPLVGASSADYSIGVDSNILWFGVPTSASQSFKWYGGTTLAATLTGVGALTTVSTISDNKGDVRAAPIQSKTSAYVLVAADAGQTISITTGGVTVNASIFSAGDMVSIFNNSGSSQTITQGTSVTLRLSGTATTGNRTLARYGVATLLCIVGGATPTFVCSGAGLT
jgi:hypothetical protein